MVNSKRNPLLGEIKKHLEQREDSSRNHSTYMLISQPIRRYMLESAMRDDARKLFLRCMQEIPFPWARHQRDAALQVWRERKHGPSHSSEGLLRDGEGHVLLLKPSRS